jgi:D-aminopeptidase
MEKSVRPRARDIGLNPGVIAPGPLNSITDVSDVAVGHETIVRGDSVRTGVTAILPHQGNLFAEKVPAAIFVGNGFGKLVGLSQVNELGEIETPILLTNTLCVGRVADALVDYILTLPGNEKVASVNPIVGETNDGFLNDIRGKHVGSEHVTAALHAASTGPVDEGSIGAGTGTVAFGFKGGIGTSSRQLRQDLGGHTVGVLVQTNFDGTLMISGAPVGREIGRTSSEEQFSSRGYGSVVVVIGTDACLNSRNLRRLAARSMLGLARTGFTSANESGDYSIVFSTNENSRVTALPSGQHQIEPVRNEAMTPLFEAVIEATEEAVYNSLFRATTVKGRNGHVVEALPIEETRQILRKYNVL